MSCNVRYQETTGKSRVAELFTLLFLVPTSTVTLRGADVSSLIQIGFSVVCNETFFTEKRNNFIIIQAIGRPLPFIKLTHTKKN